MIKQATTKASRLQQIEQDFAANLEENLFAKVVVNTENNHSSRTLLISCYHNTNLHDILNTDYLFVKIDIIIRSHLLRNSNTTVKARLLINTSNSEAFLQRLNKLGVCRELKDGIVFWNDDSPFGRFTKLFSDCCFHNMLEQKQIGYNFLFNYSSYMLKMNLVRPYPSCLNQFKNDIIIGAHIALPEFVFGVANIWINENESYGVYKMKNSNQLLIHSQGIVLENLFKLGYVESTEYIQTVKGSSLLGARVSFRGSKSDNLFILPCTQTHNRIMASVPSQVKIDYMSWLDLVKREDWNIHANYCAPTPFIINPNPNIGYFPSISSGTNNSTRQDDTFVNHEEVWDLLHSNCLPEQKKKNENYDTAVKVLLDDNFDCNFLNRLLHVKLKSQSNQKVMSLRGKIVDWLLGQNLAIPVSQGHLESPLVIRKESIRDSQESKIFYPATTEEQISNLLLKEKYLGNLRETMPVFLIYLFEQVEKNRIDYISEGHSFMEYLDPNHFIWKDLDINMIHYQIVTMNNTKPLSELDYHSMFPQLKPNMIISNQHMALDGMKLERYVSDEKEHLIDLYSASVCRLTLAQGMFDEPSFERRVANSHVLSLSNFLETIEMYKKRDDIEEDFDELDNIFVAHSSYVFLKSYTYYANVKIMYALSEGWFFSQNIFKEYIQRKNLTNKKPNSQLVHQFITRTLRLLYPITPVFVYYCWNEMLDIKDPIVHYENIPLPNSKYLIVNHLIRQVKTGKRKSNTTKECIITVCDKKETWQKNVLLLIKMHEQCINSNFDYIHKLAAFVKEHLNDFNGMKTTMKYLTALCDLYMTIGPDIFNHDWDEYELLQPHIELISAQFKSSNGYSINFYLKKSSENSSTVNPFFPVFKFN